MLGLDSKSLLFSFAHFSSFNGNTLTCLVPHNRSSPLWEDGQRGRHQTSLVEKVSPSEVPVVFYTCSSASLLASLVSVREN